MPTELERESIQTYERFVAMRDKIDAGDLAFILHPGDTPSSTLMDLEVGLAEATARFQAEFIRHRIDAASGNMTEAAEQLGLHRSNLYRKMRQLGMATEEES